MQLARFAGIVENMGPIVQFLGELLKRVPRSAWLAAARAFAQSEAGQRLEGAINDGADAFWRALWRKNILQETPAVTTTAVSSRERPSLREHSIFLSYASQDRKTVLAVYDRLKGDNFNVWMDSPDLIPGEPWEEKIYSVIETSAAFIAFI